MSKSLGERLYDAVSNEDLSKVKKILTQNQSQIPDFIDWHNPEGVRKRNESD